MAVTLVKSCLFFHCTSSLSESPSPHPLFRQALVPVFSRLFLDVTLLAPGRPALPERLPESGHRFHERTVSSKQASEGQFLHPVLTCASAPECSSSAARSTSSVANLHPKAIQKVTKDHPQPLPEALKESRQQLLPPPRHGDWLNRHTDICSRVTQCANYRGAHRGQPGNDGL